MRPVRSAALDCAWVCCRLPPIAAVHIVFRSRSWSYQGMGAGKKDGREGSPDVYSVYSGISYIKHLTR